MVASVSGSVSQAEDAARSASQSATAAAGSASAAAGNAQAAAQSASQASESASAAKVSETNAVSSASAAKTSETNAAASATAAQNAVDGFGLEVGTTTTGEPGSDASVEIQKTGTKYTANFTIPRGDKGKPGVGGTKNVIIGTASGTVASANDSYSAPRQIRVHGDATTANPEKLIVHTNNFFPNFPVKTENGITLTHDANGVYHMDGIAETTYRILWQVIVNVPSGDYVFKHSVSRSDIDGYINIVGSSQTTLRGSSAAGNKGSLTDSGYGFIFYIRYPVQQGVEYHDTVQIVLASGTDIPLDFPKNESSEVALPSGLNLVDGDTLVIDSDGSTRITHSSGEPTPSTPVTLPAFPAPTFAVYTEGGLTSPTVDVDYERDMNLVIRDLEAKIATLEVANKTNQ